MSETNERQAQITGKFAGSNWPPVSPRLLGMLDEWVHANVPTYKPGDTSDAALGVLAFHGGMKHVANALRQVAAAQHRTVKQQAIHTTTQE